MSTHTAISKISDEQSRRKTGIKRNTFKRMLEILKETEHTKKKLGGGQNKLDPEERPLM